MNNLGIHTPLTARIGLPLLCSSSSAGVPNVASSGKLRCSQVLRLNSARGVIRAQASNFSVGSGGFEGREENDNKKSSMNGHTIDSSKIEKPLDRISYPLSIALVILGCGLLFSLIAFVRGGPSTILAAIAKSGFTAAFTLIFVSEIGDKTFFIAALLAMQYEKTLVLLGSMGALSLMTVLSVIIGRIFQSVPSQFQTTLRIRECAAVTLLASSQSKMLGTFYPVMLRALDNSSPGLDGYSEAEELVKEKGSLQY